MKNRLLEANLQISKICKDNQKECFTCRHYWTDHCLVQKQALFTADMVKDTYAGGECIRHRVTETSPYYSSIGAVFTRSLIADGFCYSDTGIRKVLSMEELNYLKNYLNN